MNLMKRLFFLAVVAFLISACSQKPVFEETRSFSNSIWNRFDVQSFQIPNIVAGQQYDVFLNIQCVPEDMNEKKLWANLTFFSPENEMRSQDIFLRMFDPQGQPTVELKGRIANYRIQVFTGISFGVSGEYRFEVLPVSSKFDLTGIQRLGVEFYKHKK